MVLTTSRSIFSTSISGRSTSTGVARKFFHSRRFNVPLGLYESSSVVTEAIIAVAPISSTTSPPPLQCCLTTRGSVIVANLSSESDQIRVVHLPDERNHVRNEVEWHECIDDCAGDSTRSLVGTRGSTIKRPQSNTRFGTNNRRFFIRERSDDPDIQLSPVFRARLIIKPFSRLMLLHT